MENQCQEMLYNKTGIALSKICKVLPYVSENISQLIQRRLKELNISKAALAEKVGVSRAYIGDLANGTAKTQSGAYRPSPEIVEKLAKNLEVSRNELLNALGYETSGGVEVPSAILDAIGRNGTLTEKDNQMVASFIDMLGKQKQSEE